METLLNDVKHACRLLWRSPGFAIVVVLALAIGIGANTAVFSVMNAVLFKPLPYTDPDHIVTVTGRFTGIGIPDDRNAISAPEFQDLRRFPSSFSEIAAIQPTSYNIRLGDLPERIGGAAVSASFLRVFGMAAHIGRTFAADEEQPGRDTVVMLAYPLWQRLFQGDPNIVGKPMEMSGRTYTRFIQAMLFNVNATDLPTFALACASLLGTGLIASLIPALRATLVDPVETLRQE